MSKTSMLMLVAWSLAAAGSSGRREARAQDGEPESIAATLLAGDEAENRVVSPIGIEAVLRLMAAGAAGETASELRTVLQGFGGEAKADSPGEPEKGGGPAEGNDGESLRLASAVWLSGDVKLAEPFEGAVTGELGGTVGRADFRDPAAAVGRINAWVTERTDGRIPQLFGRGDLGPEEQVVLVSAVSFRQDWQEPFQEKETRSEKFTRRPGDEIDVPLMRQVGRFDYAEDKSGRYIQIPFADEAAMVFALPGQIGGLDAFTETFLRSLATSRGPEFRPEQVEVVIPRFTLRARSDLRAALKAAGIRTAFDPRAADFSAMTADRRRLFVTAAVQEAFVRVDEAGVEAAAGTGAGFSIVSAKPKGETLFRADRPFLFAIVDRPGRALFVGRVDDPSAGGNDAPVAPPKRE